MAGHRKWSELRDKIPAERRERIDGRVRAAIAAMELRELREARGITQEELAARLEKRQPAISRLERQEDMLVSTLREVVEALGGELEITAHFPDVDVRIDRLAS